jgi:hypothetical protein
MMVRNLASFARSRGYPVLKKWLGYRQADRRDKQRWRPRPMKRGTIASLWRYDATVEDAPPQDDVRRPAILRYAQWAAIFCASWTIQ